MAITSFDSYLNSVKQYITFFKTATRTAVTAIPFSNFDLAGVPTAGTLATGNTANGIVPTDATTGYPVINTINNTGQVGKIDYAWTVTGRLHLYDCLFSAGAYAFNAAITLASQPSFSARVPNLDYRGLEIWLEAVTAFTGSQSIRIQYLDQDGNTGDTGTIATGVAPIVGRMYRMPLGAGDSGVRQITVVTSTVSTAGTFNVHVMRPLWTGRVNVVNGGDTHSFARTGLKQVYSDSALRIIAQPDSTATALPQLYIEICDS